MKIAALSLLIGSAAAFAPAQSGRAATAQNAAMDDLKALAEKSNPVLKVRIQLVVVHAVLAVVVDVRFCEI
jgi:hypothetical protein